MSCPPPLLAGREVDLPERHENDAHGQDCRQGAEESAAVGDDPNLHGDGSRQARCRAVVQGALDAAIHCGAETCNAAVSATAKRNVAICQQLRSLRVAAEIHVWKLMRGC